MEELFLVNQILPKEERAMLELNLTEEMYSYIMNNMPLAMNITDITPDNIHHIYDGLRAFRELFIYLSLPNLIAKVEEIMTRFSMHLPIQNPFF